MRTIAIVYYARHAPTSAYAQALEDALRAAGHLAERIQVRDAAANDIIFYDALVLVGPPRFGRLHGIVLARAIAPERNSAVVVVGGGRGAGSYERLFKPAERPYITLFHEDDGGAVFATIPPVVDWVGGQERP
ncbi:hypothetical protein GCM10009596_16960 [Arthrobacter rhombi]|uniref:hypothetical protein n=1 Tax=Arthrobacter rhombi TaxID=71253 RepID=UPI0031DCA006